MYSSTINIFSYLSVDSRLYYATYQLTDLIFREKKQNKTKQRYKPCCKPRNDRFVNSSSSGKNGTPYIHNHGFHTNTVSFNYLTVYFICFIVIMPS